ncbi:MAG: dihydrofolate reductase [Clostridia bacterium]|nr:dihydrofolate reductase [Clostridia bacterium]
MSIAMIAAIGKNRELGINNDLIWHFKEDMAFFRQTTVESTVVMGRKTFESLPKALPKRRNIVITRDSDYKAEGAEVVHSPQQAMELCENDKVFIIGGATIYEQFLPYADSLYLTEIDADCPTADTFFPAFCKTDYHRVFLKQSEENGIQFSFVLYQKNK